MSEGSSAHEAQARRSPWRQLVHAGAILLSLGMIAVVAGILVAPLFLPGTWVIAVALLCFAAGGVLNVASAGRDRAPDAPDGSPA